MTPPRRRNDYANIFTDQMIHRKIFEGEAMFIGSQATTLVLYFVKLNNSQVIFQIIQDYEMLARI